MVTFAVPVVAVADAVNVTTLPAKLAVTPAGMPVGAKVTVPLNPPMGVTVIVLVVVPPCVTERLAGFADSAKSG
jgi:hypothetical protein